MFSGHITRTIRTLKSCLPTTISNIFLFFSEEWGSDPGIQRKKKEVHFLWGTSRSPWWGVGSSPGNCLQFHSIRCNSLACSNQKKYTKEQTFQSFPLLILIMDCKRGGGLCPLGSLPGDSVHIKIDCLGHILYLRLSNINCSYWSSKAPTKCMHQAPHTLSRSSLACMSHLFHAWAGWM